VKNTPKSALCVVAWYPTSYDWLAE